MDTAAKTFRYSSIALSADGQSPVDASNLQKFSVDLTPDTSLERPNTSLAKRMSTTIECHVIEVRNNQWFYLLEHNSTPEAETDWRENARAYGPFSSTDHVREHMQHHCPDCKQSVTYSLRRGDGTWETPDQVLSRLLDNAEEDGWFGSYRASKNGYL